MPSNTRVLALTALSAGLLVAAYFAALAHELVLALAVATASLAAAALFFTGGADRETVAAVAMAVTVVYGAFTFQLPAAVVAACVVYLTLWVTGASGPLDAEPPGIFPSGSEDRAPTAAQDDERAGESERAGE